MFYMLKTQLNNFRERMLPKPYGWMRLGKFFKFIKYT